jgi:hypothetical protein
MTHVPQEGDAEGCIGKREWCEDDLWLVLDFDAEEWKRISRFYFEDFVACFGASWLSFCSTPFPGRPLKPKRAYLPNNRFRARCGVSVS